MGGLIFGRLWTLFKPGCVLYSSFHKSAYRLEKSEYDNSEKPQYTIMGSYVGYNGEEFGLVEKILTIKSFTGVCKISNLPVYPLSRHPNADSVRGQLIARKEKFEAHQGQHYCHYKGVATREIIDDGSWRINSKQHNVDGAIMVDFKAFNRGC